MTTGTLHQKVVSHTSMALILTATAALYVCTDLHSAVIKSCHATSHEDVQTDRTL